MAALPKATLVAGDHENDFRMLTSCAEDAVIIIRKSWSLFNEVRAAKPECSVLFEE